MRGQAHGHLGDRTFQAEKSKCKGPEARKRGRRGQSSWGRGAGLSVKGRFRRGWGAPVASAGLSAFAGD